MYFLYYIYIYHQIPKGHLAAPALGRLPMQSHRRHRPWRDCGIDVRNRFWELNRIQDDPGFKYKKWKWFMVSITYIYRKPNVQCRIHWYKRINETEFKQNMVSKTWRGVRKPNFKNQTPGSTRSRFQFKIRVGNDPGLKKRDSNKSRFQKSRIQYNPGFKNNRIQYNPGFKNNRIQYHPGLEKSGGIKIIQSSIDHVRLFQLEITISNDPHFKYSETKFEGIQSIRVSMTYKRLQDDICFQFNWYGP